MVQVFQGGLGGPLGRAALQASLEELKDQLKFWLVTWHRGWQLLGKASTCTQVYGSLGLMRPTLCSSLSTSQFPFSTPQPGVSHQPQAKV